MIVDFDRSFYDDLSKITDTTVLQRSDKAIDKLKSANSLREVSNIKAIKGHPNHFRLRFGDFRIGFCLENKHTITLLAIDHRSKIYRHFPNNFA